MVENQERLTQGRNDVVTVGKGFSQGPFRLLRLLGHFVLLDRRDQQRLVHRAQLLLKGAVRLEGRGACWRRATHWDFLRQPRRAAAERHRTGVTRGWGCRWSGRGSP